MNKPRRRWTAERDAEVARLYGEGNTQEEVAERVGTGQQQVSLSLKRTGTPTRAGKPRRAWTAERDAEVARLYAEGKTQEAIAELMDTDQPAISRSLARTDTPTRGRGRPGDRRPGPAGDPERARRVAAAYAAGRPMAEIARQEGLTPAGGYAILRRQGVPTRRPRRMPEPIEQAPASPQGRPDTWPAPLSPPAAA